MLPIHSTVSSMIRPTRCSATTISAPSTANIAVGLPPEGANFSSQNEAARLGRGAAVATLTAPCEALGGGRGSLLTVEVDLLPHATTPVNSAQDARAFVSERSMEATVAW